MSQTPIFKAQGQIFKIDSCAAQLKAIQDGKLELISLGRHGYPGKPLSKSGLPGVPTLGIMHMEGVQDWGTDWHRNEGVEISYLESGRMPLLIEERQYDMQWRDLSFTRPWQLHRLGNPNLSAGRLHYLIIDVGVRRPDQPWKWPAWIILPPRDLNALTDILRHSEDQVWRADKAIQQCFQKLAHCVATYEDGNADAYLMIYINEMLRLLLDQLSGLNAALNRELSGRRHTVELFAKDIARNPDSMREEWTLEAMAERCGLGRSSFCRYFKDLTNMTPLNYLVRCRVEAAAEMLTAQPEMSITDVAFAVGFNSSQYFANVFRHFKKCTPREWRSRKPAAGPHAPSGEPRP